jgi:hypothetical protein
MSEYEIPIASAGSCRANPIIIDDGDEPQQDLDDVSNADTYRMSSPEYERWAKDHCSTPPHIVLTESTSASTFSKYHSCRYFDCTRTCSTTEGMDSNRAEDVENSKRKAFARLLKEPTNESSATPENLHLELAPGAPCSVAVKSLTSTNSKTEHPTIQAKRKLQSDIQVKAPQRRSKRLQLKRERDH